MKLVKYGLSWRVAVPVCMICMAGVFYGQIHAAEPGTPKSDGPKPLTRGPRGYGDAKVEKAGSASPYGDAKVEKAENTVTPPDVRTPTPAPPTPEMQINALNESLADALRRINKLEEKAKSTEGQFVEAAKFDSSLVQRIVKLEIRVSTVERNKKDK